MRVRNLTCLNPTLVCPVTMCWSKRYGTGPTMNLCNMLLPKYSTPYDCVVHDNEGFKSLLVWMSAGICVILLTRSLCPVHDWVWEDFWNLTRDHENTYTLLQGFQSCTVMIWCHDIDLELLVIATTLKAIRGDMLPTALRRSRMGHWFVWSQGCSGSFS